MQIEKVLLVDDDKNIRLLGAMSLECDWTVVMAGSGQEALDVAGREKPDVILMDVMMPGMDGPTTLSKLREIDSLQNTPVVFMTAKVQSGEVESYKRLGVAGVIIKPFDPMKLADEIRQLVGAGG